MFLAKRTSSLPSGLIAKKGAALIAIKQFCLPVNDLSGQYPLYLNSVSGLPGNFKKRTTIFIKIYQSVSPMNYKKYSDDIHYNLYFRLDLYGFISCYICVYIKYIHCVCYICVCMCVTTMVTADGLIFHSVNKYWGLTICQALFSIQSVAVFVL